MTSFPPAVDGRITEELLALSQLAIQVSREQHASIARFASEYTAIIRNGGTLFFAGNGGSAADAQHIATEYVVRFSRNRVALPAIAITTDTSLLTACGNDLGFDEIFARQVQALVKTGDLLVLHSTSGESLNILAAARAARTKGARIMAFLGKGGGRLRDIVDDCIVIPSSETSRIQELHLAVEHVICGLVERQLGVC